MDEQFKQIVANAKSILIFLPTKPFFDQVAAALALFLALREEKDTQIVSASPMTVDFNRIIGVNKITQEAGSKNLIIKFLEYNPKDIERVKFDLEDDKMVYLSVIPLPGKKAPAKDQVHLSYSGISADTVFLIGGLNNAHFPQLTKDLAGAKLVHIGIKDIALTDHHPISLARPASSVSELVYYFLKDSEITIDRDTASDLLMGIEDSTRNFTDSNATADTFMAIADLMKRGARRYQSQSVISPANFPPGAIPQMPPGMPMPPMQGQVPPGGFTPMQRPQMPPGQGAPMPYPPLQTMPGGFPQVPQARPMPQPMPPLQQNVQNRTAQRPQTVQPAPSPLSEQPVDTEDEQFENPPEAWLSKPKVYKGTSMS